MKSTIRDGRLPKSPFRGADYGAEILEKVPVFVPDTSR
jgi:hypothetical protein